MEALATPPANGAPDAPSTGRGTGTGNDVNSKALLDVMPVATFIIDHDACVVYANQRIVDMVGIALDELVGRSVLDFIDPRDVDFALSLLVAGAEYTGSVMGPSRIRYVDPTGESHHSQFWAHECPTDMGVDGYIITLTAESVRDVLATAVAAVASDAPINQTLEAVATSGRAAPLDGIGTILVAEPTSPTDMHRFRCIGDWPLDDELINAFGTPWRKCLVTGAAQDVVDCSLGEIDARAGAHMAMAGLPSAWVRPILDASGEVAAVFVVWRRTPTLISPNQEAHLNEALRLAHLALEQARHRAELEVAAHRDALTGVGNRASLNDRVDLDDSNPSVLFIDLDQFKSVNDTFGHSVGDEVIAQAGRRIAAAARRTDDVYRSGGDEFVVVCAPDSENPDSPTDLLTLADRIVERLAAPFDCNEHRVRIGATIGIASGQSGQSGQSDTASRRDLRTTIDAADRAMYVAKERGRGCVHHADVID